MYPRQWLRRRWTWEIYNTDAKSNENKPNSRKTQKVAMVRKLHYCKQCTKSFTRYGQLNNHICTHNGEKPYTCYKCGKGFTQSVHLKRHTQIHSGEKHFVCQQCGKRFTTSGELKTHDARIHSGEKPYVCQLCEKSFTTSSYLKIHSRIHSGESHMLVSNVGRLFLHLPN